MGDFQLRIEMTDWEGESRVAEYGYFRVANVSQLYRLYVTDYSGNAGNFLGIIVSFITLTRLNG